MLARVGVCLPWSTWLVLIGRLSRDAARANVRSRRACAHRVWDGTILLANESRSYVMYCRSRAGRLGLTRRSKEQEAAKFSSDGHRYAVNRKFPFLNFLLTLRRLERIRQFNLRPERREQ